MKNVLIIAGGLHVGGAEKVAANISKYSPNEKYEFHYVVFEGLENVYGPEIEKRGGKVFTLPSPSKSYLQFMKNINNLMKKNHYVAVHSHTMFNSGIVLCLAILNRIPCRIAHSHTTKTEVKISRKQAIYQYLMRIVILLTANHYFACGVQAGYWLFGKKVFDKKGIVINNGIDTEDFKFSQKNRDFIRQKYSLGNRFVIGHSGTLIPLKNQQFLIELMPKIKEAIPDAMLVLVGGGDSENKTRLKKCSEILGVSDSVIFAGQQMNVNEILSAFDVYAFPSLREGTPLALLEAQTNGLPCLVSDAVPKDAFLTDLVKPMSLDNEESWVYEICHSRRKNSEKYPQIIDQSGYSALTAYRKIYEVYDGKVK